LDHSPEEDSDDLVLSRRRNIRTRAASTPNTMIDSNLAVPPGILTEEDAEEAIDLVPSVVSGNISRSNSPGSKWGGLGMQWSGGNSIWQGSNSDSGKGYAAPEKLSSGRSMSYSNGSGMYNDGTSFGRANGGSPYENLEDDEDYDEYVEPKNARTRSKSSSAIHSFQQDGSQFVRPGGEQRPGFMGKKYTDMPSIWSNDSRDGNHMHRRASTQPSTYGAGWDSRRPDMESENSSSYSPFTNSRMGGGSRRFSHAPNMPDYSHG
jgi:hypothetical protein